ncbi:MAG: hypothetical protein KJ077_06945 [Anaerolineae bacterium]|nr:hypothetical protein [Anaerolineae bacterium]
MKKLAVFFLLLGIVLTLAPAALAQAETFCESDVVVQADDWLSKIADKFYGDVLAYEAISKATNAIAINDSSYATISNVNIIEPGWKLCVPSRADAETLLAKPLTPVAGVRSDQPLKVALAAEPRLLEPTIDTIKPSLLIDLTIMEPLAMNTAEGGFVPWLATSWSPTALNRWRLTLKEGVQFHNGEPFNADAVLYSLNVYKNTDGEAKGWYDFITGAEKVDEFTVDLITAEPTTTLPPTLAFLFIFPPQYHAQLGSDEFGQKPIGTGPWRFVEWNKGVDIKVEPNPDYWGQKPFVGEIHFRWAPDPTSRVALLETGEVHLAENIPPALIDRVENSGIARIETVKGIRKAFLRMNLETGPTADVRVRRALNHAINVEAIIETLFLGRAYGRDTGFILDGMEGHLPGRLKPYEYNPDLAKQLLAEAGYPDGFDITFHHTVGRYILDVESAEAIAAQLGEVGIKVELVGMEPGAYFSKISASRVEGLHFAASAPLFLTPLYHPLIEFELNKPYGYGANEQTDAFTKQVLAELDTTERIKVLQEFEDYVFYEHVPWVWLWHYQDIYGVSNEINWTPRPDQIMSFEQVTFR